jgi:hypothetical protein
LDEDDIVSSVVLNPVKRRGFWSAELAWPTANPSLPGRRPRRRFGKFISKEETEKWIEEHRWLTEQREDPDISPDTP